MSGPGKGFRGQTHPYPQGGGATKRPSFFISGISTLKPLWLELPDTEFGMVTDHGELMNFMGRLHPKPRGRTL